MIPAAYNPRQAVDAGTAFLEVRYGPLWFKDIDLETFELIAPCRCVLGQLDESQTYYEARERLSLTEHQAQALGFEAPLDNQDDWEALHNLWIDTIAALQESA